MIDPRYSLAGLIVGLLVGFSGVGAGSLMTPLLILLFRTNPLVAVGTDLLYAVPTKLLGAFVHGRQRTVDWRLAGFLALGGVPGACVALAILGYARGHVALAALEAATRHAVGVAVLISAAAIVLIPRLKLRAPGADALRSSRGKMVLIGVGAFVGVIVAFTSIGAGSITLPILLVLLPSFDAAVLVGSDVAFGAMLVPIAAAGHWSMHDVNLGVCASLLIGSLPGVYFGSKLSRRIPQALLRPTLAGVLVLAGSRLV